LLASEDVTSGVIAHELEISPNKVGRWRNRYADKRHVGIEKD